MEPGDATQIDGAVSIAIVSLAYAITYRTACMRRFWIEARYVRDGSDLRTKRIHASTSLSGAMPATSRHDEIVEEREKAFTAEGYAMHRESEIVVPGAVPIQGKIDLLGVRASDVVFEEVKAAAYDHQRGFVQVKLYDYYARSGYLVNVDLKDAVSRAPTTRRNYYSGLNGKQSPVLALNIKELERAKAARVLAGNASVPDPAPSESNCRFCIADEERCDQRAAPLVPYRDA